MISILLPKQFHYDEISQIELSTMYWIMTDQNNCFGYLIRQYMQDIIAKDSMLPYKGLVTRLMLAYNICVSPNEEII